MPDAASRLPAHPSLEQLRKQAKDLLKRSNAATLAEAQLDLARQYGFDSWPRLVHHVEGVQSSNRLEQFERLGQDLAAAYAGDADALERLGTLYGISFSPQQLRMRVRDRLIALRGRPADADGDLTLEDARLIVAQQYGFESWAKLGESLAQPQGDPRRSPLGLSAAPPFYKIDWKHHTIEPLPPLSDKDWDTIVGVMKELRIGGLNAGHLTDAALARIAELDHVTTLRVAGSRQLTDDGLAHLARMPQLEELAVGGWTSPITDRGLEVLSDLPALKTFHTCWSRCISDAGVANLRSCGELENVDLMGSPTGNGAIAALTGKPRLRRFKTGTRVTDAGIPLLHQFPCFEAWKGGEIKYDLMSFEVEPSFLLLDGPFTNNGLTRLAGLNGLFGISFFWHASSFTPDGLAPLKALPSLGFLGLQGKKCDDEAMRHIGEIPRLRMLMGQGTVASDDGFVALSRSQSIEYIWGRECPNLRGRGFAALARMPALRGLAVSCKSVDDDALSTLPTFPALDALMPMDVQDSGFRHVGRCERLEHLWCMYCQDTGDIATGHIRDLPRLRTYYAGSTRITDVSLQVLGGLSSLEAIHFWEVPGITNAGVTSLAKLPRLREITIEGSPQVTREGAAVFPPGVRVSYSG